MMGQTKKRQRGGGLVEAIAAIAVASGLAVGAIALWQLGDRKATVNDMLTSGLLVKSRFIQLSHSGSHLPEGDVTAIFARDRYPGLEKSGAEGLSHKWAVPVTVESEDGTRILLMFNNMSKKHCRYMLSGSHLLLDMSGAFSYGRVDDEVFAISRNGNADRCLREFQDVGWVFSTLRMQLPGENAGQGESGPVPPPDTGAVRSATGPAAAATDSIVTGKGVRDLKHPSRHSAGRDTKDGGFADIFVLPLFDFSAAATPAGWGSAEWGPTVTSNRLRTGEDFPIRSGTRIRLYGDGDPGFLDETGRRLAEGVMPDRGLDIVMAVPACGTTSTVVLETENGRRGFWSLTRPGC